jgi:hypothetical protein
MLLSINVVVVIIDVFIRWLLNTGIGFPELLVFRWFLYISIFQKVSIYFNFSDGFYIFQLLSTQLVTMVPVTGTRF